jgi:hypothetical protein
MGGRTHARSTKESSVVNLVLTGVHVVFILFIIVMGFAHGDARNLSRPADPAHSPGGFFPHGAAGVFNGAAAVYLSYIGYDAVSTMAEEVERPDRDIPAGVSGSVVLVTVLYCLMATSMSMLLPYDAVRTSVSQSACLPSEMKEDAKSAAMYSDSATATGIVFYDTFADIGRAIWNESILYSAVPIPIAEGTSCNFLGVKKSERERERKRSILALHSSAFHTSGHGHGLVADFSQLVLDVVFLSCRSTRRRRSRGRSRGGTGWRGCPTSSAPARASASSRH